MSGSERLAATLDHTPPDRVCVDFGATFVTGLHVSVVSRVRRELLGAPDQPVKVIEPYQMLGEIDDELREVLGIDVIGIPGRRNMFGTEQETWRPFRLFDGTEVLFPGDLKTTEDGDTGDLLAYPEGDPSVPPSGRMPKGGYFFDAINRQEPIVEERLDPTDNLEEFGLLDEADLAYYRRAAERLDARASCGAILAIPGAAFGDIALVPAPFLKHPRGIRGVTEWYISLARRPDYVRAVFEGQCRIAEQNVATLIDLFGERVQAALITGTDFGMQTGPILSEQTYRGLFKPFHERINRLIHSHSCWKTFIHSCGSVYRLIPDFIEAGFDILNPVQCSAADMEPGRLKKEFGDEIVFWGGGVNTQHTMAFGTPNDVYDEACERIGVFNEGGGFVFGSIHNIQGDTPTENVLAMFRAIRDAGD